MVLRVNFEAFADSVKKHLSTTEVYVARRSFGVLATAADPVKNLLVVAPAHLSPTEARKKLEAKNLKVVDGEWSEGDERLVAPGEEMEIHVAAVSYLSNTEMAGLWVDAFDGNRTTPEIIRTMYEEFVENGEAADMTLEEFVRLANPNVVVLSPEELIRFAERNRPY